MKRIAIPALVAMLAVAAFVGAAGWNASEEPRLVITLTERELQLPHRSATPDEPSALELQIAYHARFDPLETRNWLPASRLREMGFATEVPVGSPDASYRYDHVPPRLAWVVFEYDGPEWRDIQRRAELRDPDRVKQPVTASRLVPVDAGASFDDLRMRYPAGHLILRGVIGLSYVPPERGGPMLHGVLRQVVPQAVSVPYRFRSALDGLGPRAQSGAPAPRYEAELAVGSLGLPYIRSLRSREGTKN